MARDDTTELRVLPVDGPAPETEDLPTPPANMSSAGELDAPAPQQQFSLPPVDGGKDAWLFLAACFSLEALVWGLPFAFGVFQDYYSSTPPFAGSPNIAVIGTCAMGVMYLDTPLIMGLLRLYPTEGRWANIFGLLIMCTALAMSSFSTKVEHLIVTQGILYAIGGSIAYSPCIVYLDEWFVKRKGLAYGLMWSGTGLAGVVLPLLFESLLSKFGFQTTLRAWAVMVFVLTAPLSYFIKPRLPPSASIRFKPFDISWVFSRRFLLYQLANAVEATGFFLPGIFLPSYARVALGATSYTSALTVLCVNVASVVGCISMGSLIDRFHVTTCILVSTVGATLGTFVLWGCGTNLPILYVFCVVYGLFAGSFTSTWPGVMREITKPGAVSDTSSSSRNIDPSMVFAFLALGRGVGNVIAGPLSEALVENSPWKDHAWGGWGSGYGSLIAFTGVTALFGGGSFLWRRIGWL